MRITLSSQKLIGCHLQIVMFLERKNAMKKNYGQEMPPFICPDKLKN